MSSSSRSGWFTTFCVAAGAGAILLGVAVRDKVDIGSMAGTGDAFGGRLWASRSTESQQGGLDIPESEYFRQMTDLLKDRYVDPITDEQKLAVGAVRGMVSSLDDSKSLFFDKDVFKAYQSARTGTYEGIGADLELVPPPGAKPAKLTAQTVFLTVPSLTVRAVAPGGPADKAGVKPGDVVDTIDTHWVLNPELILRFREMSTKLDKGQVTADALKPIRKELREKSEKSIMPMRALEMLIKGTEGDHKVIFRRGKQLISTSLTKRATTVAPLAKSGDTLVAKFSSGLPSALKTQIPQSGTVKLDFRQNASPDFALARDTLSVLAPKGTYGSLGKRRGEAKQAFTLSSGSETKAKYTIVVDATTRGAAATVALALQKAGLATLQGTPSTDRTLAEVVGLPDGSGFVMSKFDYSPEAAK